MAANIPSIQLATLDAILRRDGIACDTFEFYLDYAASIGWPLYNVLSNGSGFVDEWLFANQYFTADRARTNGFRDRRPALGIGSRAYEDRILDQLVEITGLYLDRLACRVDWTFYDVIGFSLTISQTAASMALARLIKERHPEGTIVFGGTACAGPMGPALARVCPEVDLVVSVEGEHILPRIVRQLRSAEPLQDISGLSFRLADGTVSTNSSHPVLARISDRPALRFDSYFERLNVLGFDAEDLNVWLPFESSRGCWYGEKSQCTFCGLHEIMKFRRRPWEAVLEELEEWAERYSLTRFFAVDLIMPREHLTTFLPEIVRRGHDWTLFFEIKSNVRRSDLELMRKAGVRWIQPGLESLDDEALRAMRKGATALGNVQLLKWCKELGIHVTWNFIIGVPGENATAYGPLAERLPQLHHLTPPSGVGSFELHRFSPYFETPGDYGLRVLGAHPFYEHIFPVSDRDRDEMTYHHAFELENQVSDESAVRLLKRAVKAWKAAGDVGARLDLIIRHDGTSEILDARVGRSRIYALTRAETELYLYLDQPRALTRLHDFAFRHTTATKEISRNRGLSGTVEAWLKAELVFADKGRVVALATNTERAAMWMESRSAVLAAPLPYLGNTSGEFLPQD